MELKYNIDWLKANKDKYSQLDYLYFWGHTPKYDDIVDKSCLSQWYDSPFVTGLLNLKTAEHYMMYGKAIVFKDEEAIYEILAAKTPKNAKFLGSKVKNFNGETWDVVKIETVFKGNMLKFTQHTDLAEFLIKTKDKILVEASPYDKIWGVGLGKNDPLIKDVETWKGENLLGFTLMEVRDELLTIKNIQNIFI